MKPVPIRDVSYNPFDGLERSSVAQESPVVALEVQWAHALVVGEVVPFDAIRGSRFGSRRSTGNGT